MLELKPKRRNLNSVIPNWLSGQGIMSTLTNNYDVPWKQEYSSYPLALDIAYQGSHSGQKLIAPFVEYFLDPDDRDATISNEDLNKMCMAVWVTYHRKWEKLWELYMKQYDPFYNYDMQTDLTEGIQSTGTKTGTVGVTGTETLNNTDTTTKTGTISENETENVSGKDTTKDTGTQTNTKTFDNTDTTHKTGTVNENETENVSGNDKTTNSGYTSNTKTLNTQKETEEGVTYGKTDTQSKTGDETHIGKDTENDHYITNDVSSRTENNQLWGFNSTTAINSDATQSANEGDRVHDETKIQSSRKIIEYGIDNVSRLGGTDTTDRLEAETGTVTDRFDDNLISNKAQSSITTTQSAITNNLTDETEHTGSIEDKREDDTQSVKIQSSITTIQSSITNNLTDETSHTGTISNTSTTTNDLTDEDEASRTLDEHKYGNIGIASIQRMFKEEVENWAWIFMNDVFADLDAMLVLAVH